jgi:hypothetical protein
MYTDRKCTSNQSDLNLKAITSTENMHFAANSKNRGAKRVTFRNFFTDK